VKPIELDLDAIPKRPRKTAEPVKEPARKHAAWRRIVRSLRIDGPQSKAALNANLGIGILIVEYILRYYLRHGVIERVGRKYKLTETHANFGKPEPCRIRRAPKPKSNAWTKIAADED